MGAGRYAFAAKLALGGMAAVYRVWDHKLRVWRAVKVLLPDAKDHVRVRFEAEAKMMARIDHPHVIRIYDVGTSETLPYIVMELADGGTLNGWIDEYGPMPPQLAVRVAMEVALGLSAAHAINLVHRDVKPHNVLITSDGRCKVTDFGIAHWTLEGESAHNTQTGMSMGTLGYMAPEQRNDARKVDARADVYSLGALLYKLVVGKVMTDLFLVEHEPALLEGVPLPLHEVIVRACYRDRQRRYPDIESMRRVLAAILPLLPPDPPSTPPLPLPRPPETEEDYAEISMLLDDLRRASRALNPRPYTMSRPKPVVRSTRPESETVPAPLPSRSLPPTSLPGLQAQSRTPIPVARTPSPTSLPQIRPAPSFPPHSRSEDLDLEHTQPSVHSPTESAPRPWVQGLAIASAAMWGLLAALVVVGMLDVNRKAEQTEQARIRLLDAVRQETGLIPELTRYGTDPRKAQQLAALYDVAMRAEGDFAELYTAITYATAVDAEARRVLTSVPASDLAVVRARNISRAWANYARARADWTAITRWPHGRIATVLHLAPKPVQ